MKSLISSFFFRADDYARLLPAPPEAAREARVPYRSDFHWSERHLQCVWFDARYRPAVFPLPGGETLTVLDPGEWNLEAGPDFLNATLRIDPGARRLCGDVEIHVRPSDWDAHGHAADPAYARVAAHVTWFEGPAPRTLPPGVCAVAMSAPVLAQPGLSLDDIDLKAYPHAALPATPRPCEAFLKNDPDRARELLAAAGHFRLAAKTARLRARLDQSGDRRQVFYEEVMAALGYKHNQTPFRALARLLPAAALAGLSREAAFAQLLGVGRLLPQPEDAPDEEGRRVIRKLWDFWWRNPLEPLPDEVLWRLGNIRPQNAPVRRLAAAACLFAGETGVLDDLDTLAAARGTHWHKSACTLFARRCRWPFWNHRLLFSSQPDETKPIALLGETRIAAILTNVAVPFAAAEGALATDAVEALPPEDLSAPMRLTALHLFGRDHNPALYTDNGLLQQGLLQIHLDFCLNAKPGCDTCALCAALKK